MVEPRRVPTLHLPFISLRPLVLWSPCVPSSYVWTWSSHDLISLLYNTGHMVRRPCIYIITMLFHLVSLEAREEDGREALQLWSLQNIRSSLVARRPAGRVIWPPCTATGAPCHTGISRRASSPAVPGAPPSAQEDFPRRNNLGSFGGW